MARIVFAEVVLKGVFRWRERPTGRIRQRTRKFSQTINPWNKNAAGLVKSREEIWNELKSERDLWLMKCTNDLNDPSNQESEK